MFGVGPTELIIILVLALIIFGPGKLPEVGRAIGRSIKEFKAASSSVDDTIKQVSSPAPSTQAPAQATVASTASATSGAAGAGSGAGSAETADNRANG